eukprot:SAG25_NODE_5285_length_677_cov_1.839100_2_plen_78_part_01
MEPASASARKQQHFKLKSGKRVRVPNERTAGEWAGQQRSAGHGCHGSTTRWSVDLRDHRPQYSINWGQAGGFEGYLKG